MESADGESKRRKTMKPAANLDLDNALYQWFVQSRTSGIPLSGPLVSAKAIELNQKLGGDSNFKASIGWLDKFKKRHGIRQLTVVGEKLSCDDGDIADYRKKLMDEIESQGFTPDQVFNADETGLFWKAFPQKTLAPGSETNVHGFKMQKERLTVLVCGNASGSGKMPLTVIGKSKEPRAFKNFNMANLPVHYYAQKKAWMDATIFCDWFPLSVFSSIRHTFGPAGDG